ncbi:MAG: hypothetical protein MUC49_06670 [Raineya sp.]|jgi:transcription initiation factor IIE alpha subunit|nr:hypothetical protein [Raineya sp.]
MPENPLRPFLDALKEGKTLSCYTSDDSSGYINQYYAHIQYDLALDKIHIETKDVMDGGYPDIEIMLNHYDMDWEAFVTWFESWKNKINQIKIMI